MADSASFLIFVKALDWTKIISAAVPLILGIALAWWKGGFRFVFRKIQRLRAERKYKSELKRTISSLAVIGRREGFDLAKVYVEIDIAKSNLMNKSDNEMVWTPKTFVLVGGPGAGKSTYVKKLLLDQLATKQSLPFFLRLREYSGEKIEDLLAAKLDILGIVHSLEFLRSQLRASGCLCVLDGLDEVRPAHQHAAHEAINSFHKSYFLERGQGRLIVTCRKEAYRSIPLELPEVWEVVPLKDNQIKEFARTWPLGFPNGKSAEGFWNDLSASPRILEVSRSPLLLVGSLLLYTESNLGIPGERTKYLQKIKNTLVEDWGTAQGHAPDPWRIVYTPLLSNIALQMHLEETPEFPKQKCTDLIAKLLPEYGYEASQADVFLENLFTKTGILVRDVPGTVVFVQFTLQEYFASLILSTKCSEAQISKFAKEAWWREAILFSTAQLSNPTSQVKALFEAAPMMGAVAVAEVPTPSLELQQAAIDLTLKQIDAADGAAELPTVSLLRKISGKIERDFCASLGQRLEDNNERVSAIAGRSLATAGTVMATETLSQYPEAWKHCLDTSSYLSGSFEKMLFNWVGTPSHLNWQNAVDLLVKRDEKLDVVKLIDLIATLPHDKADYLASALLKRLYVMDRYPGTLVAIDARAICRCIPFVQNKERLQDQLAKTKGVPRYRRPGVIPTALELAKVGSENSEIILSEKLLRTLDRSVQFCFLTRSYTILMASAFCSVSFLLIPQQPAPCYFLLAVTVSWTLIAICLRPNSLPWMTPEYYYRTGGLPAATTVGVFLAGAALAFAIASPNSIVPNFSTPQPFYVLAMAGIVGVISILRLHDSRVPFAEIAWNHTVRDKASHFPNAYFIFQCISILWLLAIGLYLFAIPQGKPWIFFPQVFVAIAVVLFSWCIVQVILSGRDWRSMRLAARSADRYFMDITL